MGGIVGEVLGRSRVVYIGDVRVSRATKDKVGGKPCFAIYLPIVGNSL